MDSKTNIKTEMIEGGGACVSYYKVICSVWGVSYVLTHVKHVSVNEMYRCLTRRVSHIDGELQFTVSLSCS